MSPRKEVGADSSSIDLSSLYFLDDGEGEVDNYFTRDQAASSGPRMPWRVVHKKCVRHDVPTLGPSSSTGEVNASTLSHPPPPCACGLRHLDVYGNVARLTTSIFGHLALVLTIALSFSHRRSGKL